MPLRFQGQWGHVRKQQGTKREDSQDLVGSKVSQGQARAHLSNCSVSGQMAASVTETLEEIQTKTAKVVLPPDSPGAPLVPAVLIAAGCH